MSIGQAIPGISFTDDSGFARTTSQWKGNPTILIPIYTQCNGSCPMIARSLKKALLNAKEPLGNYRVVLFSFDPRDRIADLRAFRNREHLPLNWLLARADPTATTRLVNSIGFHYTRAGSEYLHPNIAAVLDPRLKLVELLTGENYSSSQIDLALQLAQGGSNLRLKAEPIALGFVLFLMVLSAGFFFHACLRRIRRPTSP